MNVHAVHVVGIGVERGPDLERILGTRVPGTTRTPYAQSSPAPAARAATTGCSDDWSSPGAADMFLAYSGGTARVQHLFATTRAHEA